MKEKGYVVKAGFWVIAPNKEVKEFTEEVKAETWYWKKTKDKLEGGTYFGMSFLKDYETGPKACSYLNEIETTAEMAPVVKNHKEAQDKAKAESAAAKEKADKLAKLKKLKEEGLKKAEEAARKIAELEAGS